MQPGELIKATTYPRIVEAAEFFGVDIHWAVAKRIVFLKSRMTELSEKSSCWEKVSGTFNDPLQQAYIAACLEENKEKLAKLRHELKRLRSAESGKDKVQGNNQINDEMIARAKATPITNVIDFNNYGKAFAFCHADKHPSLHWNRDYNQAYCFVCHRPFNAVDVLVYRDGYDFKDAVLELAS